MATIWQAQHEYQSDDVQMRGARAATGFAACGIRSGDAVAIMLRNDVSFLEVSAAAAMLGAYIVAINWHYTPDEAGYILKDCRAKMLVIHADLLLRVKDAIPNSMTVLVVGTPPDICEDYGLDPSTAIVPDHATSWDAWLTDLPVMEGSPKPRLTAIIYTSGTTGRPKGVKRAAPNAVQTEAANLMLAKSFGYLDYLASPEQITTIIVGPVYHAAPNAHATFSFRMGANIIISPRFDPERLLVLIEKHKVTHLNMAPIMFHRLLKLPEQTRQKYDLSSLRFVVHAAAPISPSVKCAMIKWWGPVIYEYYGSTEMGNVTFCDSEEWLAHRGTVGRAMPNTEIRIVAPNGSPLPTGVVGEILARIAGTSDVAYHNIEASPYSAGAPGFVAPGDMGYLDEEGYLFLCDRVSDMIISGGVNIYPAEIEAELSKISEIADSAVFGVPDDEFGEAVVAAIQLQPGAVISEDQIRTRLRSHIASFKIPRKIWFDPSLPREDSGKIFKRKLREPFWAGVDRRI